MKFTDYSEPQTNPSARICEEEYRALLIRFCTLICITHNKKLNLANIFLLLLKDKNIMSLYKCICDIDTDYISLKKILEYDNSLYKSKYIKKYLNTVNKAKQQAVISNDQSGKRHL